MSSKPCHYGVNCTNGGCTRPHPPERDENLKAIAIRKAEKVAANLCSFGNRCTNKTCTKAHPPERDVQLQAKENAAAIRRAEKAAAQETARQAAQAEAIIRRAEKADTYLAEKSKTPCWFGSECTNKLCGFGHPSDEQLCFASSV